MTTLPVSILIPVYNAAPHLEQCIQSAIAQNAAEVILIDDGSTDGSGAIAQKYASQINVQTRSNLGAQATRNQLFQLSTQNWIQYLDADDWLQPGKIQAQLDHQGTAGVLYCDFTIERWQGQTSKDEFWTMDADFVKALLLFENPGQTNAFLYRRDWLAKVQWDTTATYQPGLHSQRLSLDLLKQGATFQHVALNGFTHRRGWSTAQITDPSKTAARLKARAAFQADLLAWVAATYPNQYASTIALVQKRFAYECEKAGVTV